MFDNKISPKHFYIDYFLFYYMKRTLIKDNRYEGRTLIVDDMNIVYEKLKDKFTNPEYAGTVKDGLRKLHSGKYDVIVSDYHLGKKSPQGGLEIIRAAKKEGLTGILMSKENHRKEAEELGAIFMFKKEIFESEDINKLLEDYDGRK